MKYRFEQPTPVGKLRLFATDKLVTGLYFEQHTPAPKCTDGKHDAAPFAEAIHQLEAYFAGERQSFDIPIQFQGTDFQVEIWNALRNIPLGETTSYGKLAKACNRPKAVRAVGAAVGRNPISIIVPCHRVVGTGGQLTGFAGGIERKRWLLDHERAKIMVAN